MELFDGIITLLGKTLDRRSARHQVLAANIANADTPGYKAMDLVFDEELKHAVRSGRDKRLARTQAKHFPDAPSSDFDATRIEPAGEAYLRIDRNTVDVERQMVKLAENTLMYEVTAQMLSKKFRGLKETINEGR